MNHINVTNLAVNTYYAAPVWLDEKYILLSQNVPVTEALAKRLKKWNYAGVYTDGSTDPQTFNDLESGATESTAMTLTQNLKEQENINDVSRFYKDMLEFTEKRFTDFVTKNDLSIKLISDKVKETIEKAKIRKNYILRLADMQAHEKSYIVAHSVKTTILSCAVGAQLKLPPHKLIELGTAALLHEIGMIRLPPQLYMSDKVLTPEEKRAITAHTVLGFKILKQFGFPMPVCLAVLEHHEHPDGTGYPRGVTGERISLAARIIGLCSAYAALVSKRPYRSGKEGHSVLVDLLKGRGRHYDESVLKALVFCLSLYPVGSYVLLANNAKGLVVETNIANPKAPTVKVLISPSGTKLSDPYLVKSDEVETQITRPLEKEEIADINPTAAISQE
ncbi:MAG: HD-GYP domain-containing protein [Spirochaetales bacterium]|jgi:HD-GYP domain-containing protein (c-di-GMP phosphodiesterase class II)|nr:HD-GYP domain-containing protein [Spirochaetales bacterium]